MKTRTITTFALSAAATAALCTPAITNATIRRTEATACHTTGGTIAAGFGLQNNSAAASAFLRCPFVSDDDLSSLNANSLRVYGYDGHNTLSVTASACVTNWDIAGGACGASGSSGAAFVGHYNVDVPRTEWNNAANSLDYPYVLVTLPPDLAANASSSLRGVRAQDP